VLGASPIEEEVVELLRLIYVQVLDLDRDSVGEREARNLLRAAVLHNPEMDAGAWSMLVSLCASLAANRSGATVPDLHRELLSAGFALKIPIGLGSDVERLRAYSRTIHEAVKSLSVIKSKAGTLKIRRPTSEVLGQVVEQGSILVTGEPGSGKSAVLTDLVESLTERDRDFVFLAVDRVECGSLSSLRREIGIERDLLEILENWPGKAPAFVVIDALDAARDDVAQQMVLDLIRLITSKQGRWRVVASIRKYDLRNSPELQSLFAGGPPSAFCDPEFRRVRHLNVPQLSDDELDQLRDHDLELWSLFCGVDQRLRGLLRVPYNLRLLAEIACSGEAVDDLQSIRTQLELFDRYWTRRVIRRDGRGDAREAILKNACGKMLEARTLRVNRFDVVINGYSEDLDDLVKNQVLVERQPHPAGAADRYTLAFSHHSLFDYAVARLWLRGDHKRLVNLLRDRSELVLMARPSLVLHFRHVWESDRTRAEFWNLVLDVFRKNDVPAIAKLIGPSVAAEAAKELADLETLCIALCDTDHDVRHCAIQVLKHLCGAALAGGQSEAKLVGEGAGPWCDLLERVSVDLTVDIAHTIRPLLVAVCERSEELTTHQRCSAGLAVRRTLEVAWSTQPRSKWLVVHALQGVCRTYVSSPKDSAQIISRCIETTHLARYGYEEMPWLAREVPKLVDHDPALVAAIYQAAFAYEERSHEPTSVGGGFSIQLVSNRQQDYSSALYVLAEFFPMFLSKACQHATQALIAAVESYVARWSGRVDPDNREYTVELGDGRQMRLVTDDSYIWDGAEAFDHNEPIKMLNAFEQYLLESAKASNRVKEIHEIIDVLIERNRYAVVWRHVIRAACGAPDVLGRSILPLICTVEFMACHDTSVLVGNLLSVLFPILTQRERHCVERTILAIPERATDLSSAESERTRNRLLGCLTDTSIVSEEVRALLGHLKDQGEIPPNKPITQVKAQWTGTYGDEEHLKDLGVPTDDPPNRFIRYLEEPVRKFVQSYRNSTPPADRVSEIMGPLRSLYSAIAETQGVHAQQLIYAWSHLAQACTIVSDAKLSDCDPSDAAFVQEVLVRASHCDAPAPDPLMDSQFDAYLSWGAPAPRVDAAEGLVIFASKSVRLSQEVIDVIFGLADDLVPAVRFQIARGMYALARHDYEQMWDLIERRYQAEQSRGVLQGLLVGTLRQLVERDPDRVATIVAGIYKRQQDEPGADKVRMLCISLVSRLYFWSNHRGCGEIIAQIAHNAVDNKDDALHLLSQIQGYLTLGAIDRPDPSVDDVRNRAMSALATVVQSVQSSRQEMEHRMESVPFDNLPMSEQGKFRSLAELEVSIAELLYFASGAYGAQKAPNRDLELSVLAKRGRRFYREAKQVLEELADTKSPAAAQYLIETLEFCIPFDPAKVFVTVGRIVRAASRSGYQYDSLAADLLVRIVERYIAEYRTLLKEDSDCVQTLIKTLDVFVEAGWPSARRLTYHLEWIYR
jgi:hypothetical protein